MNVSEQFEKRVQRSKKFLKEKKPGTILLLRPNVYGFEGHWINRLMKQDISEVLDSKEIASWNELYLKEPRQLME